MVVSGGGVERPAFDTPYAISVIDAEALRRGGPMVNLSETLNQEPGLMANPRNNYAQDQQISSLGVARNKPHRSGAGIALGPGTLSLLAQLDNIGNVAYAGAVIANDGNGRFFETAAGRHALLALRWRMPF